MRKTGVVLLIVVVLVTGALVKLFWVRPITNLKPFADLRGPMLDRKHLSLDKSDLTNQYDDLLTATFDSLTQWPPREKMPSNYRPGEILDMGKDPGLGIRALHYKGITGEGVKVAIIDQPLLLDHVEYRDKVIQYTTIDCEKASPQMHGAAVASLLVGTSCGVAPDAELYYWAEPSWKRDYRQRVQALEEIIAYNEGKSPEEQIRIVSVSIGYQDIPNIDLWKATLTKAEQAGIVVVHCSAGIYGVGCKLYEDVLDVANYDICYFAREKRDKVTDNYIFVPVDNRTFASSTGVNDYTFNTDGGLSWGAPYLAGVIALGYQVNPHLNPGDVYNYLRETGTPFLNGCIVNPSEFIRKIETTK